MCKVIDAAVTFRFDAAAALPCICGAPAVFAVTYKFKRKPGYMVFPLCESCGASLGKYIEDQEIAAGGALMGL